MPDSQAFQQLKKGYTLHVYTAGSEEAYTLHSAHCTIILLAIEMVTICTMCTSIQLAVERDTPCTSVLMLEKDMTIVTD